MKALRHIMIGFTAGILSLSQPSLCGAAATDTAGIWSAYDDLTARLSSEAFRMELLGKEIEKTEDLMNILRSFEIYPVSVTHLSDDALVVFDRRIETCEKQSSELKTDLAELREELSDAAGILRELAGGTSVAEMFTALDKGDISRRSSILALKHRLDALWTGLGDATAAGAGSMGLPGVAASGVMQTDQQEFMAILKESLSGQSDARENRVAAIRDLLLQRATAAGRDTIMRIEKNLAEKDLAAGRSESVERRVSSLLTRPLAPEVRTQFELLILKARFKSQAYESVVSLADSVQAAGHSTPDVVLQRVQSLYALERYADIWTWATGIDLSQWQGAERNMLIWCAMESGLRLGIQTDFTRLAGQADMAASYNLHILHALARTYAKSDRMPIAASVLRSALLKKPIADVDRAALTRIRLTTAQVLFESSEYQNSLSLFFEILSSGDYFEDALSGIAWNYIRLGQFQNAEATLLKLINQAPASAQAAEAFTVVARRLSAKAGYEWRKTSQVLREENDISVKLNGVESDLRFTKDEKNRARLNEARTALSSALVAVHAEHPMSTADIDALHRKALDLCALVGDYYASGSFSRVNLSLRRENVLRRLDSLRGTLTQQTTVAGASGLLAEKINLVKSTVLNSRVLGSELSTNRFRYLKERIDWQKKISSDERIRLSTCTTDSCTRISNRASASVDSLVAAGDLLLDAWYADLTNRATPLMSEEISLRDKAYLQYQLGELQYIRENRSYAQAYDRYEQAIAQHDSLMDKYSQGLITTVPNSAPPPPVLAHDSSMQMFRGALAANSDDELTSAAWYSLAWCFNDLGRFDSAVSCLATVADTFPDSRFAAQACMFLGEYQFDNNRLEQAAEAYKRVMTYTESEWFDDALYKLAWTQYRLSNPEKAISSFLALVDLGKAVEGRSLLEKESLDYIAISFSECDLTGENGLVRAMSFVKKLEDSDQSTRILHRLAQVYKDQGRFDISEKTYRKILAQYPGYEKNPQIESELFAVAARNLPAIESNDKKMEFFEKYNHSGHWAKTQKDTASIAYADSIAEAYLYDAALVYHQAALAAGDTGSYTRALGAYRKFITVYAESKNANECNYNLAEILFSIGKYSEAAREYVAVSRRYPDGKYKETASWNAIVAAQNMLKLEGGIR